MEGDQLDPRLVRAIVEVTELPSNLPYRLCLTTDDRLLLLVGQREQIFGDPKEEPTRAFVQRIVDAGRM